MFKAVYVAGTGSLSRPAETTTITNPAFPPSFQPPSPPLYALTSAPSGPSTASQVIQAGAKVAGAAAGGAIIGGALGTLIPIPGVGTAIGAALGGAVAPAVVNTIGSIASSVGDFFGGLF